MLLLPYKRFPFAFNGDFTVAGALAAASTLTMMRHAAAPDLKRVMQDAP
jgi:hypothetical protein